MKIYGKIFPRTTALGLAFLATTLIGCTPDSHESAQQAVQAPPPDTVYIYGGPRPPEERNSLNPPEPQPSREEWTPPTPQAGLRPVAAGGSYRGDIELVQLEANNYLAPPDAALLLRSTIAEDCFGPIVRVQANGAASLMVVGQVPDNGFVSRKRVFLEAATDSLRSLDPSEIQRVRLELFVTGIRLTSKNESMALLVHQIPPGWDIGGGMAIQTTNEPSSHHSHFITPVETPAGAPALLDVAGYDLAWNHGGASWDYARSQSGLTTWTEFLEGEDLHEQPVIGRWEINPENHRLPGGVITEIEIDLDYVRRQLRAELPLSIMIRHEHDAEADSVILNNTRMQGEVIAMSENAEDPNAHPRLLVDVVSGRRHVIAPLSAYTED